jgi:hypothetical protein
VDQVRRSGGVGARSGFQSGLLLRSSDSEAAAAVVTALPPDA